MPDAPGSASKQWRQILQPEQQGPKKKVLQSLPKYTNDEKLAAAVVGAVTLTASVVIRGLLLVVEGRFVGPVMWMDLVRMLA